jgi:alcohol dehydrogenase class IV
MPDVFFNVPAQVYFGADCALRLAGVAARLGKRALLVTEAILYERGVIDQITTLLSRKGLDPVVYDEVIPGATSSNADEAARLARGGRIDLVIALGGVKTLSIARLAAAAAPASTHIDDMLAGVLPDKPPLALVELTTTCRNPFMFGGSWLVTDARDRSPVIGRQETDATAAVFVDPKLATTLPSKYLAATMMDTLMHAVEGYLATGGSFLSDMYFTKAIETLGPVLRDPISSGEELAARNAAARAGLLTALGLSMGRSGVGSALSYALNARLRVPKSWAATVLLPRVLEHNLATAAEKIRDVGRLLGEDLSDLSLGDAAGRTIEAVRGLIGSLGLPARLRDFGLAIEDMIEVAEAARRLDLMTRVARVTSADDLYELLKAAY